MWMLILMTPDQPDKTMRPEGPRRSPPAQLRTPFLFGIRYRIPGVESAVVIKCFLCVRRNHRQGPLNKRNKLSPRSPRYTC
jgi:hypothetical protein